MKKNNKGYTLVEIIIAIAIIGVVTSAGTVSFRLMYNTRVSTAGKAVTSYCKSARLNNMTKKDLKYIHIYKTDSSNYVYVDGSIGLDTSVEAREIGNIDTSIEYVTDGNKRVLYYDESITLYFTREGRCIVYNDSGVEIPKVTEIRFSNGTRRSVVSISQVTGKVTSN